MRHCKIMGIVNCTPDSYFEASRCKTVKSAVTKSLKLIEEGADILDIGGESTRPETVYRGKTVQVSEEEEVKRVIPVIKALKTTGIPLSIDTMKSHVAAQAVEAGATMINDVSGFRDEEMRKVAADCGADICVMHMQGNPQDMQINPQYPTGIISYLESWFQKQIELLLKEGIAENRITIDPGIGFGKSVAHNIEIVDNLPRLKALGFPLLLGLSRKSFLAKIMNKPTEELLFATLSMNTLAIKSGGVDIIRVHDVEEHKDIVNLLTNLCNYEVTEYDSSD